MVAAWGMGWRHPDTSSSARSMRRSPNDQPLALWARCAVNRGNKHVHISSHTAWRNGLWVALCALGASGVPVRARPAPQPPRVLEALRSHPSLSRASPQWGTAAPAALSPVRDLHWRAHLRHPCGPRPSPLAPPRHELCDPRNRHGCATRTCEGPRGKAEKRFRIRGRRSPVRGDPQAKRLGDIIWL